MDQEETPTLSVCLQLCPAVQRYAVPQVNSMLENISMAMTLYKDLNIDYSLSGDVTVASTFLDVPFKVRKKLNISCCLNTTRSNPVYGPVNNATILFNRLTVCFRAWCSGRARLLMLVQ